MSLALASFAIFFAVNPASAAQSEIYPQELFPGDPFVVKISGVTPPRNINAFIEGKEIPLSSCGADCFIGIGVVDPETNPGDVVIIVKAGMEQFDLALSVKKAEYPEMHLKLPKKQVTLNPEDLARAREEEAKLRALWQQTTERLYQGNFIIPLRNLVSTVFGAKRIINNNEKVSVHRGIDIKGRRGEEVRASNRGRVVMAEDFFFGGNTIVIDHGLGIYTVYMHLDKFAAKPGDIVSRGDVVGFVGSSGRSTGPHLHFGVKILTCNVNPLSLVNLKLD